MPTDRKFWTPEREALLGTEADTAIAKSLGVTPSTIGHRRERLGIPSFGSSKTKWGQVELALFRSYSDAEITRMTGRTSVEVVAKRRSLLTVTRIPFIGSPS
jgi:hypothetical protein